MFRLKMKFKWGSGDDGDEEATSAAQSASAVAPLTLSSHAKLPSEWLDISLSAYNSLYRAVCGGDSLGLQKCCCVDCGLVLLLRGPQIAAFCLDHLKHTVKVSSYGA